MKVFILQTTLSQNLRMQIQNWWFPSFSMPDCNLFDSYPVSCCPHYDCHPTIRNIDQRNREWKQDKIFNSPQKGRNYRWAKEYMGVISHRVKGPSKMKIIGIPNT